MNEKQSKATPGPWVAECVGDTGGENPVEVWEVIAGGYVRVAEGMSAADAKLLAAAPDLLEALRTAVQLVETDVICARPGDRKTLIAALKDWNAAITKATQGA